MDTIIYSAIGMVIIVSTALSITFFKELSHRWKHVAMKIRGFGAMLGRDALDHHKTV